MIFRTTFRENFYSYLIGDLGPYTLEPVGQRIKWYRGNFSNSYRHQVVVQESAVQWSSLSQKALSILSSAVRHENNLDAKNLFNLYVLKLIGFLDFAPDFIDVLMQVLG